MIRNERQYKITNAQASNFRKAVSEAREKLNRASNADDLLKWKLQMAALEGQLTDLETDLREYESLQEKRNESVEITSLDELPSVLVKARIASGLTQKQLAAKLGLKEQQIQRYEATEYSSASLKRVNQVVRALGLKVKEEVALS